MATNILFLPLTQVSFGHLPTEGWGRRPALLFLELCHVLPGGLGQPPLTTQFRGKTTPRRPASERDTPLF